MLPRRPTPFLPAPVCAVICALAAAAWLSCTSADEDSGAGDTVEGDTVEGESCPGSFLWLDLTAVSAHLVLSLARKLP